MQTDYAKLMRLLGNPSKEMLDAGMSAAEDCKDSDWDSGGDGEGYYSYEYFRSDAAAVIFKAMVEVALKQVSALSKPRSIRVSPTKRLSR
jgi:hypothetical protein